MGHVLTNVQNLEVVKIDLENNIILIKGNVPGPKKSMVVIKTAVKNPDKVNEVEELMFYEITGDETDTNETVAEETTNEEKEEAQE